MLSLAAMPQPIGRGPVARLPPFPMESAGTMSVVAQTRTETWVEAGESLASAVGRIHAAFDPHNTTGSIASFPSDRRADRRSALRVPVEVTAAVVDGDRVTTMDGPFTAETVDVSLRGASFTHPAMFFQFHSVIAFRLPAGGTIALLAEQNWTVQEGRGRFRSGARFLAVIEPA
jgi:hypothetical protein